MNLQNNWDALAYIGTLENFECKSYLEIGVCEGRSLRVALEHLKPKSVVLCDKWTLEYGGSGRGNHRHIQKWVGGLNHVFLDGDSRVLIPTIAHRRFDVINVDGDHSLEGARIDLENCLPMLNPGGFLVFDDINHPRHQYLWGLFKECATREGYSIIYMTPIENSKNAIGVGIVRRDY